MPLVVVFKTLDADSFSYVTGLDGDALKQDTLEWFGPKSDYEKNPRNAVHKKPGKSPCLIFSSSHYHLSFIYSLPISVI